MNEGTNKMLQSSHLEHMYRGPQESGNECTDRYETVNIHLEIVKFCHTQYICISMDKICMCVIIRVVKAQRQ